MVVVGDRTTETRWRNIWILNHNAYVWRSRAREAICLMKQLMHHENYFYAKDDDDDDDDDDIPSEIIVCIRFIKWTRLDMVFVGASLFILHDCNITAPNLS